MQMDGVWTSNNSAGHRDLDGFVGWERVHAARGKEVLGALGTAEDLEEHGDGGWGEGRSVDVVEDLGRVLSDSG